MAREIRLAHESVAALEHDHQENLRKGRAFVLGAGGVSEREPCTLVLVHPETRATLALEAEVVWVQRDGQGAGVGVQLVGFGDAAREALRGFVDGNPGCAPATEEEPRDEAPGDVTGPAPPRNLHERIRALSIGDRGNVARTGTLSERIALERSFGASVWEALLANPQLTPPEVARIAKNGTITRPLVQVIVGNAAWLAVPEIQRALLSNPRVSGPSLDRVLRALSRAELQRIAGSTAYRVDVRSAAKAMRQG